jgi:RNA polymerase sigma-70 factor, ECF subfamily
MGLAEAGIFKIEDQAAFEALFHSHYSKLCGYANTFLKDPDASEEIVQEVMFKIWVNRDSLQITTSIQSYLFRAVRNGCMNLIKHLEVREDYRMRNKTIGYESGGTPEEGMIVSELEQQIREAIDRLPLERRKVFILSRYDGLSYAEIAEKLNISVKTVENQMGKALKTLREELEDYLPLLVLFLFDVFRN